MDSNDRERVAESAEELSKMVCMNGNHECWSYCSFLLSTSTKQTCVLLPCAALSETLKKGLDEKAFHWVFMTAWGGCFFESRAVVQSCQIFTSNPKLVFLMVGSVSKQQFFFIVLILWPSFDRHNDHCCDFVTPKQPELTKSVLCTYIQHICNCISAQLMCLI